jgi:hypothetical protein
VIAVLLIIFLVTAYAGPGPSDRSPLTVPTTAPAAPAGAVSGAGDATGTGVAPAGGLAGPASGGTGASRLVGQCLKVLPSSDSVVPCATANDGRVIAQVEAGDECPATTRPYRLIARDQIVCLDPSGA